MKECSASDSGALAMPATTLLLSDGQKVSARWRRPSAAKACLVLAHGAGAGMDHPFMAMLADRLAGCQVATLRFQFPSTERGSRRPDPPAVAHAAVRAAVAQARRDAPDLPLFAGGKSFGGRMTSQAQALEPLPGVTGLVFFGFPLHPAGKPGVDRADHLKAVGCPMLFLQGTRDALADLALLEPIVGHLGGAARLELFETADHAFHMPARSGYSDAQVLETLAERASNWMAATAQPSLVSPAVGPA